MSGIQYLTDAGVWDVRHCFTVEKSNYGDVQMLTFVLPTEQNREDVLAFYRDIEENGEECIGIGNYKDYDMWLTLIQNRRCGRDLPEGYVRENFYLCYESSRLIGVFDLKFELTEFC